MLKGFLMHRNCIQSAHKPWVLAPVNAPLTVAIYICMHTYTCSAMYGVVESELLGNRTKQLQKSLRTHKMSWFMSGVVQPTGDSPQKGFLTKTHQYPSATPQTLLCLLKDNECVLFVSGIYSSLVINICIWHFNLLSSKLTENHKPLYCRAFLSLSGGARRIVCLRSVTEVHPHHPARWQLSSLNMLPLLLTYPQFWHNAMQTPF